MTAVNHYQYLKTYYAINLFFVVKSIAYRGHEWLTVRPHELVEFMFWIYRLPFPGAEIVIMAGAVIFNALVLYKFSSQTLRIISFIFTMSFWGRFNTYDHIDHNYYFIIYPLFFSILPRKMDLKTLEITSRFCITSVFLPFTMAGTCKVVSGIYYLLIGADLGAFSDIYAFHRIIGKEAPLLAETSMLYAWSMAHPLFVYILYLLGIALQVVSAPWAYWGRGLVFLAVSYALFQLGTLAFMTIFFEEAFLVAAAAALLYPNKQTIHFPALKYKDEPLPT